jgi:hypothetical protein
MVDAMSGAWLNQPKKHRKNANHVRWKVLIWTVWREKRSISR